MADQQKARGILSKGRDRCDNSRKSYRRISWGKEYINNFEGKVEAGHMTDQFSQDIRNDDKSQANSDANLNKNHRKLSLIQNLYHEDHNQSDNDSKQAKNYNSKDENIFSTNFFTNFDYNDTNKLAQSPQFNNKANSGSIFENQTNNVNNESFYITNSNYKQQQKDSPTNKNYGSATNDYNKENNGPTNHNISNNLFNSEFISSPPKNIFAEVSNVIIQSSEKKSDRKNLEIDNNPNFDDNENTKLNIGFIQSMNKENCGGGDDQKRYLMNCFEIRRKSVEVEKESNRKSLEGIKEYVSNTDLNLNKQKSDYSEFEKIDNGANDNKIREDLLGLGLKDNFDKKKKARLSMKIQNIRQNEMVKLDGPNLPSDSGGEVSVGNEITGIKNIHNNDNDNNCIPKIFNSEIEPGTDNNKLIVDNRHQDLFATPEKTSIQISDNNRKVQLSDGLNFYDGPMGCSPLNGNGLFDNSGSCTELIDNLQSKVSSNPFNKMTEEVQELLEQNNHNNQKKLDDFGDGFGNDNHNNNHVIKKENKMIEEKVFEVNGDNDLQLNNDVINVFNKGNDRDEEDNDDFDNSDKSNKLLNVKDSGIKISKDLKKEQMAKKDNPENVKPLFIDQKNKDNSTYDSPQAKNHQNFKRQKPDKSPPQKSPPAPQEPETKPKLQFQENHPTSNLETKIANPKPNKKIHVNEEIENRRRSIENFFAESINFNHGTFNLRDILNGADQYQTTNNNISKKPLAQLMNPNTHQDNNPNSNDNKDTAKIPQYQDFLQQQNPQVTHTQQHASLYVYPSHGYKRLEASKEKNKLINTFYNKKLNLLDNFKQNVEDQGKTTYLMSNSTYLDQDNFKGISDDNYKALSSITRSFNNKLKLALSYSQRITYYKNVEIELNAQIYNVQLEKEKQKKRRAEELRLNKYLEKMKTYENFYERFLGFKLFRITTNKIDNTMDSLGITIKGEVMLNLFITHSRNKLSVTEGKTSPQEYPSNPLDRPNKKDQDKTKTLDKFVNPISSRKSRCDYLMSHLTFINSQKVKIELSRLMFYQLRQYDHLKQISKLLDNICVICNIRNVRIDDQGADQTFQQVLKGNSSYYIEYKFSLCLDDSPKNIRYMLFIENREDRGAKKGSKELKERLESLFNREKFNNDDVEDGNLLKRICIAFDEEIYMFNDEDHQQNSRGSGNNSNKP